MSVLLDTSLGEIVIDLLVDDAPIACLNFLKLCKIKYYSQHIFHFIERDLLIQAGDPSRTGRGGSSVFGLLGGAKLFQDEVKKSVRHDKAGTVSMANSGPDSNGSQFFILARDGCDYLDGKHTVFGHVAEGLDVVRAINQLHHDERGRPFRNCRIKSVAVLDDPFPDPPGLDKLIPAVSPTVPTLDDRPDADEKDPLAGLPEEEVQRIRAAAAAKSRAVVLEMIGDLPDVDVAPPDNVLFVCKLNPATVDEDLELIFSRFGVVKKAEVIRDHKTGDSLNYAFIEFEQREACEQPVITRAQAYEKMNNVIIDDRRIRCDFSQSVMKEWKQYRLQLREKAVKARQERAGGIDLGGGLQLKGTMGQGAKYEMLVGHEFGAPPRGAGGGRAAVGTGGRDWAGRDRDEGRSDNRRASGGGGDKYRERRRSRSRSRDRDRGRDSDRHRR